MAQANYCTEELKTLLWLQVLAGVAGQDEQVEVRVICVRGAWFGADAYRLTIPK